MGTVRAGRVRARALALIFVYIDPVVCKAFFQHSTVFVAERSKCLQRGLLGLFVIDFDILIGNDRGVQIVEVQLVYTQQLFAQTHIAMHGGQTVADGRNQIVINLDRHFGAVQGGVQGRVVAACIGEELQLLHLCAEYGGRGVAVLAIHAVQRMEGIFTQHAVGRLEQGDKSAVGDRMGLSLTVHSIRKGHVGIVEHGKDIVRALSELTGSGQQRFALARQRVRLLTADAVKYQTVVRQTGRSLIEAIQRLVRDGEQFGCGERVSVTDCDSQIGEFCSHLLIDCVSCVLIALALCVVTERVQLFAERIAKAQIFEQGVGGVGQMTLEAAQLVQHGLCLGVAGAPGFIRGENIGQRPLKLRIDLRTGGNGFGHRDSSLSDSGIPEKFVSPL